MNHQELLELIGTFDRSTLTRIKVESDGQVVELEKAVCSPQVFQPVMTAEPSKSVQLEEEKVKDSDPTIDAPLVGIFYGASAPGEAPFVKTGDKVSKGSVLCILEAMKVMNEVTAPYDLVVVETCVENESIVEFGQPLFVVRKA